MTVDLWRIAHKQFCAFLRYNELNILSKCLYLCILCTFLKIQSHLDLTISWCSLFALSLPAILDGYILWSVWKWFQPDFCCKGGLITQCHNKIRNALGDLAALGYQEVVHEPIVHDGIGDSPALIADLERREVHFTDWLSSGWIKSYGHVLIWIRVHLAFAIIWTISLCFCISSMCWQSKTSIDDGAGLLNVLNFTLKLVYF